MVATAFVGQMTFIWGSILSGPWLLPAAAIACAGFCMSLVNAPLHALLMLRFPREVRTQGIAFSAVMQSVGSPIGLLIGGWALAHFHTRHVIAGVLAVQTVSVLMIVAVALGERAALRTVNSPA
jgi:MFS family permease